MTKKRNKQYCPYKSHRHYSRGVALARAYLVIWRKLEAYDTWDLAKEWWDHEKLAIAIAEYSEGDDEV